MPKLEIKEPNRTVEIKVDEVGEGRKIEHLTITDPQVLEFLATTDSFAASTGIASISAKRTNTTGDPIYQYSFTAKDGRVWAQTIQFVGGYGNADPAMTFTVSALWKESEFSRHRAVREALIAIINRWWVTKIEIIYT